MITHLVVGPPEHGVSRYAERLAQVDTGDREVVRLPALDLDGMSADRAPTDLAGRRVLCHFTDRLFGTDAEDAARRLGRLCRGVARLTVVLHDLPQRSDGAPRAVRSRGYLRVCELADTVIVNSRHEELLLRALTRGRGEPWADELRARTHVVPLPVPGGELAKGQPDRWQPDGGPPTVATLGFLYPGKGVEEVIDAAGRLSSPPRVINLGMVSTGHEDLTRALSSRAQALGVDWSTTGWLTEEVLQDWLRSVTVPVAAHRHLSASGSISSWLGAGRRPLVTRSRYAVEMADRMPGALTVVDDLAGGLAAALADPARTWLPDGQRPGLREEQAASRLVVLAGGAS